MNQSVDEAVAPNEVSFVTFLREVDRVQRTVVMPAIQAFAESAAPAIHAIVSNAAAISTAITPPLIALVRAAQPLVAATERWRAGFAPAFIRMAPALERFAAIAFAMREECGVLDEEHFACALAVRATHRSDHLSLFRFVTDEIGLPRGAAASVATALLDTAWREKRDPIAYVRACASKAQRRRFVDRSRSLVVVARDPDPEAVFRLADPKENTRMSVLPSVIDFRESRSSVVDLDPDCWTLVHARIETGASRDRTTAARLGWSPAKLGAVWRRLNRRLALDDD